MKTDLLAHSLAFLALSVPSAALADEVTTNLSGTVVPVGPAGTTIVSVMRSRIADTRFAVIRSRSASLPSRCNVPAERVTLWANLDGVWTESANQVFDRCPADHSPRVAMVLRARMVQWTGGGAPQPELHVRLLDPRLPPASAPLMRFHRVADRWVTNRIEDTLASRPGEAPTALPPVANVAIDGNMSEWRSIDPWQHNESSGGASRTDLWLSAAGSQLRFAARIHHAQTSGAPSLSLQLSEPGISTAVLRSNRDNHGRTLTIRCEGSESPSVADATVRCGRDGDDTVIEGQTDLATMLWSTRVVSGVSAVATVTFDETHAMASNAEWRLRAASLPRPFDVMEGASADALRTCASGFRGRVSASAGFGAMDGLVTCGTDCRDGMCEHALGTRGASARMSWLPGQHPGDAMCMSFTGEGASSLDSCRGPHADQSHLVGQIQIPGYDLVVAIERDRAADGARNAEVWALVTASARWQSLWTGSSVERDQATRASIGTDGANPSICWGHTGQPRCERVALTLTPPEESLVTASVMRTLRDAGLTSRRSDDPTK